MFSKLIYLEETKLSQISKKVEYKYEEYYK